MDAQETRKYQEDMKIARMRLEITEATKEAVQYIRQYNGSAVKGDGFLLLPGDYCAVEGNCLATARGCSAMLDEKAIMAMIESGALSHAFNPRDLNSDHFHEAAEAFLDAMGAQRHWHDADHYRHEPGLGAAIAIYDVFDGGASALHTPGGFKVRPSVPKWAAGAMECTYDEFNPGAVDIAAELSKGAMENANRSEAMDKLREHFLDNGRNDVHETQELPDKAEDIPGYDKLSPMEKLRAQDDLAKAKAEREAQAGPAEPEQWGPRMPGQSRYDV